MTAAGVDEKLAELAAQTTALQDLFRRRLLEDRSSRAMIEDLKGTISNLEDERAGRNLIPFLEAVGLLLVRIRLEVEQVGSDGFLESVHDELVEALSYFGVESIDHVGAYDASIHEIIEVAGGEGSTLVVHQVVSPGFTRGGHVLKPAKVIVTRSDIGDYDAL